MIDKLLSVFTPYRQINTKISLPDGKTLLPPKFLTSHKILPVDAIDLIIKKAFALARQDIFPSEDWTMRLPNVSEIEKVVKILFPNANDFIHLLIISKYFAARAVTLGMQVQSSLQTYEERSRHEQQLLNSEQNFMDASSLLRGWYGFTMKERKILARFAAISFQQ